MDANTVLITIGVAMYLLIYWKKGGNAASTEVIAMYKNRDELQDKQRKEMMDQVHTLTQEVGRLNGVVQEKDKRIETLEKVDLTRNPAFLEFMQKLTTTAADSEVFMQSFKDLPDILSEIKTFMGAINAHMEQHR